LNLGHMFNDKIESKVFPKSLKYLNLGTVFNQPLDKNSLPKNITHLTFCYSFNQHILQNVLPSNLTHLTFGFNFNKSIYINVLPTSITHLKFGYDFNNSIGILPSNLTHLAFGEKFDQLLDIYMLPSSLQKVYVYSKYKYFRRLMIISAKKNFQLIVYVGHLEYKYCNRLIDYVIEDSYMKDFICFYSKEMHDELKEILKSGKKEQQKKLFKKIGEMKKIMNRW